jgi:hypothetical protein
MLDCRVREKDRSAYQWRKGFMWLCEGSKIDWTAVAAVIALVVWLYDKFQRGRERTASAQLLAQIMTTPVGTAQIEIAKLRCAVVPSNGDQSYLLSLLNTQETRKDFASKASLVIIDLPSQFLDKADIFSRAVNSSLANAFSQVSRLKSMSRLLGDLSDSAHEEEINEHVMAVLKQIQEAEKVIGEAFQILLDAGKSSR